MSDQATLQQMNNHDRIKVKADKANGGITTLWAVRNAIKKLGQEWEVAQWMNVNDGKGKGHLMVRLEWNRIIAKFGNDRAAAAFKTDLVNVAESHGYEVTSDVGSGLINVVQVQ